MTQLETIKITTPEPCFKKNETNNPVVKWLNEIRFSGEMESTSALNTKSVAFTVDLQDAMEARNSQNAIKTLKAESINLEKQIKNLIEYIPFEANEFKFFKMRFDLIENEKLKQVIEFCKHRLNFQVNDTYSTYKSLNFNKQTDPVQLGKLILSIYDKLILDLKLNLNAIENNSVFDNLNLIERNLIFDNLKINLLNLIKYFKRLVDQVMKKDCKIIYDALYRHDNSIICVKFCLTALLEITHENDDVCRIFTENYPVIKTLINFIQFKSTNKTISRIKYLFMTQALRIMSQLCVCPEAIHQIYTHTAIDQRLILILNETNDNTLICEAVRLLFEITKIYVEFSQADEITKNQLCLNEDILNKRVVDQLVECLNKLLCTTNSRETFLLTSAVFSHISYYECYPFIRHCTLYLILQAFENRITNFVYDIAIKEQTLILLANISSKYPIQILESGALVFIINSLNYFQPNTVSKDLFYRRLEQVQINASRALCNLANNPHLAQIILNYQGVNRLVLLIKDGKRRNFSTFVLDESLRALRRIALCLGPEYLNNQDYIDCLDLLKLPIEESIYMQPVNCIPNELYV